MQFPLNNRQVFTIIWIKMPLIYYFQSQILEEKQEDRKRQMENERLR